MLPYKQFPMYISKVILSLKFDYVAVTTYVKPFIFIELFQSQRWKPCYKLEVFWFPVPKWTLWVLDGTPLFVIKPQYFSEKRFSGSKEYYLLHYLILSLLKYLCCINATRTIQRWVTRVTFYSCTGSCINFLLRSTL